MTYEDAKYIADGVVAKLVPHCEKIKICGSLRRMKREVKDLDIVCVPKRRPIKDLFGGVMGMEVTKGFIDTVNEWQKIKGEPTGKYTQRKVDGITLELTMCILSNFGNMCVIRTGDADFSHMIMKRINKMGLEHKEGYLYNDTKVIPCFEEEDFFRALVLPFIQPEVRDKDIFKLIREVR